MTITVAETQFKITLGNVVFGVTCLPFAPSPHLSTHSKKTPKNTTVNFPSLTGLLLATPSPQSVIMLWAETPQT